MNTGTSSKDLIIKEIDKLVQQANKDEKTNLIFIGIAGIPGAGKSTLSSELMTIFPLIKLIPMDGYHIYRKDLDENGMVYRGAPFTFNSSKFKEDLFALKKEGVGLFPSFDHSEKDPREGAIQITKNDKIILIEGLYLFCKDWGINDLFDIKLYLECTLEESEERVASRHVKSGIESNMESALARFRRNDHKNAEYVMENSLLSDKTYRLNTSKK
jgi:pantothenate kinase